jgi:succinate dehydrogenase / fumarate reductase cytochrome b subunit
MADVNRGNRPLSPHLTVYRWQIGMAMSIFHRLTGIGLTLAGLLVVCWFLALGDGPEQFARVDGLLTSWLGGLILFLSLAALWYHFFNGVRHLFWDAGEGFELGVARISGLAALGAAAVMTLVTLIAAFV